MCDVIGTKMPLKNNIHQKGMFKKHKNLNFCNRSHFLLYFMDWLTLATNIGRKVPGQDTKRFFVYLGEQKNKLAL